MKFGIKFGGKKEAKAPVCYHPWDKCKAVYEDPSDSTRRTGVVCTVCGERIR